MRRTLASLLEGGGFCEAKDGGSVVGLMGHSPSRGLRPDSPLREGAKDMHPYGERLEFVKRAGGGAKKLCVLHRRTTVYLPISPILHFDENFR